jgi:tRNA nucleotidyltransferase/poly(A) polymerase
LLREPCVDWDLITEGNAHQLARLLADFLGGSYAHLHEKASRVTVHLPADAPDVVLDIAPLHGTTLADDLRARDFTLNALALPLTQLLNALASGDAPASIPELLTDPLHGLADLQARLLRAVDDEVFRHDPLRMLRALRLARRYGLTIEAGTEGLIRRDAALLKGVAPERIHDELYMLLALPDALTSFHLLDDYGLLSVLFPELEPARAMLQPLPHYWDVFEHSLQSVGMLEILTHALENRSPNTLLMTPQEVEDLIELRELLAEGEQQGLFRLADLHTPPVKLAALLHDVGKPLTRTISEQGVIHFYSHPQVGAPVASEIMRRLSASTHDRRLVQLVTAHHMRPGQLGQEGEVTPRAMRRYFVDLGPTGILIALFSLADHQATLGPQPRTAAWTRHLSVVRLLLTRYIRERASILPPRLVRPEELMSRLRLSPGPLLGQLLERIAEAQADGTVHSREEALLLAREYMHARKSQQG